MAEPITIAPMDASMFVWRCLHGGPLDPDLLASLPDDDRLPWERYHGRNLAILEKCTHLYGSCAMLACAKGEVIGILRFYPTELAALPEAGLLCLQQDFPAGPADNFAARDWPAPEVIVDRTLAVHCLTVGKPGEAVDPYRRRGIGTALVRALIAWARAYGWRRIEATAYADLGLLYTVTGQAGLTFWRKLGFQVLHSEPEPALSDEQDGFVRALLAQAAEQGVSPDEARLRHIVGLES